MNIKLVHLAKIGKESYQICEKKNLLLNHKTHGLNFLLDYIINYPFISHKGYFSNCA